MAKHGFLYLKAMLYVWATTSLTVQESAMGKTKFLSFWGVWHSLVVKESQVHFS